MKKIVCIDSWTKGTIHFFKINKLLYNLGYKLIFIHTGSFKHEKGRPKEEYINGLHVRDISYYNGSSSLEILKREKPYALLFLSLRTPIHMSFNRCAKFLDIPTCHLYHGLLNIVYDYGEIVNPDKIIVRLKRNFFNIYSSLRYLIPMYFSSLLTTKASIKIWLEFVGYLLNRLIKLNTKKKIIYEDCKTNIGCVYSPIDVFHMQSNYGLEPKNIFTVGNPDLIKFKFNEKDFGCMINAQNKKKIIYIETGLLSLMMINKNINIFIEHILKTREAVEAIGFKFAIKLKPNSNFIENGGISLLKDRNIEICEAENFVEDLKECKSVIVEPTTAALIPAALGLPILLACYGPLSDYKFGKTLTSYPKSIHLTSLSSLSDHKDDKFDDLNYSIYNNWMNENIGPFPSNLMPNRVVDAILTILKN